ncbi:2-octaprenyl-6-methoxyphenyl hydroxylase [Lysobacter sp. GX 14042]|uniref:2-octaprenyl-6-methoxyphenyl hydroxylase n=1 Tax=Lysobacter sp. GX 14042 TaxID=2907155 RepID=UPI001F2C9AB1|nr:2-octaprenyl-6-methoxyphenyl hydroxylase [Lysobacter sp. GX 14042]MCE7031078.1 2-octaprenyl-6-methoxyphenyl hydroxylase [Lysobacter sp. GX 14042]
MTTTDPAPAPPAPAVQDPSTTHDVVIVGGGLVGASLAIALEGSGLDVVLLEASAGAMPAVFDQRNLSFAEATVNALAALGVMRHLQGAPAPIRRIHVSRAGDFGRVVLEAGAHGREAFGQVVVARDFGHALEARLAEMPGLRRLRPARFLRLEDGDGAARVLWIADAQGERTLRTRLLVGADGAGSAVRGALGIGIGTHDYAQTLFVARLQADRVPDGTAFERLGDDGPAALLPRADRHYGLVLAVPRTRADEVAAMDEAAFVQLAQRRFGWRAGRFIACGPRTAYPAVRTVAAALVAPRAVLVGNAAQAIHPVGAQGFNLGLRDALTLAEEIRAARAADPAADCGAAGLLARHATRRVEDRARTLAFSDGLARVTANSAPLLRPLRSLGLLATGLSASLQAGLVGGAMGYRGDVPALCRDPGVAA